MRLKMMVLATVLVAFMTGAKRVDAARPAKVRISYSSRGNSLTPFYLAAQKGFFAEEGMEAELIQVNPQFGATAVLNGDIDLTTTFGTK